MSIMKLIVLAATIALSLYTGPSFAKSQLKNIHLPIRIEVGTSVRDDAKLEHGIYLFNINCVALDSCSLQRISLNECVQDKKGISSFTPKVYEWASWAGFLEANLSGNVLELMVFQGTHHQLPAKVVLTFDSLDPSFAQLKSFKASGFVDFRVWPEIDTRIEYVPLQSDRLKQLDCPVFLPGIHH